MAFLKVVLQFPEKLDPIVRAELEQIVAALQTASLRQIPVENGGLGIDASQIDDGEIPIGIGASHTFALARIGAGAGISVSSGPGRVTISATGGVTTAGAYAPMSTGAEPLEVMSDGAGAVLMIGYAP